MKGSVDIFQVMLANVVVLVGFVIVIMFIGEIAIFNASVTKPSIETIQVIDETHQIEKCLGKPDINEIALKLKECKLSSKYVEIADLDGQVWKEGLKSEGQKDHTIWVNIKNGDSLDIARLYVKI